MGYIDFHSHILPHMDDGAKDVEMSVAMLGILADENVSVVYATPHYYRYLEDEVTFLERRSQSAEDLRSYLLSIDPYGEVNLPEIRMGAEIRLTSEPPEFEHMADLMLEGTELALLELPYEKYRFCMGENIYNLSVKHHLTPVIAHVERYVEIFRKSDYADLLSIPNAVFQMGTNFAGKKKSAELAAYLIKSGYPVIFGSDCHNITSRPPLVETAFRTIEKFASKHKIPQSEIEAVFDRQSEMLQEGIGI